MMSLTTNTVPSSTIQTKLRKLEPKNSKIKHIIAVASGSRGVGKSTLAVNMAVLLAQMSLRVGLLDADINSSKIARTLGLEKVAIDLSSNSVVNLWQPFSNFGVQLVTLNSDGEQDPLEDWCEDWCDYWLEQELKSVLEQNVWGDLDYLIVNLPPGMGTVQRYLVQRLPIYGVVAIATPQEEVIAATYETWEMFEQLKVPLLGLVENKSPLSRSNLTRRKYQLYDRQKSAIKRVPYLGYVPLDAQVAQYSDRLPIVLAEPLSVFTGAVNTLAWAIASQVTISSLKS